MAGSGADSSTYYTPVAAHGPGISNVGSYQVSGIPFVTGSESLAADGEDKISFSHVTRSITVQNHTADVIRVHFASKDTANTISGFHFIELDGTAGAGEMAQVTMNVKCSELYISAPDDGSTRKYRVWAELTGIGVGNMFPLSGAGIDA